MHANGIGGVLQDKTGFTFRKGPRSTGSALERAHRQGWFDDQ